MYTYVPWFLFVSYIPSECVYQCPAILSLIVGVYVLSWSEFCSLYFSEGFYCCSAIIIVTECTCIGTSLDLSHLFGSECPFQCPDMLWLIVCTDTSLDRVWFSLSIWRSVVVFGYIVTDCRCIFPSLDPCFSLSFSLNTSISVRLYCHWLFVRRYVSWSTFLSLSFVMSVSVSGVLSVNLRVYVRLLIRTSVSLSLALNVRSSVQICYDSLYVHIRLLIMFVFLFLSGHL